MATIGEMSKRFDALNVDEVIYKAFKDSEVDMNDLNLEQIYDGKNKQGENIHPSYLEDPFFKGDIARAAAYAAWKQRITPNPRRDAITPNLYINGFYHRSRTITVLPGGNIIHGSSAGFSKGIDNKYGDQLDGLGGRYKEEFLKDYLIYPLSKYVEEATGLTMKK